MGRRGGRRAAVGAEGVSRRRDDVSARAERASFGTARGSAEAEAAFFGLGRRLRNVETKNLARDARCESTRGLKRGAFQPVGSFVARRRPSLRKNVSATAGRAL